MVLADAITVWEAGVAEREKLAVGGGVGVGVGTGVGVGVGAGVGVGVGVGAGVGVGVGVGPLQARIALLTFSRPPVVVLPDNEAIGSTLAIKLLLSPAVSSVQRESTSAAAPETWGVAIEVPLK
ncbi:MAG: hypothetical protein NVSMB56_08820 [Pyrinomonadaceae bacterium]